MKKGFAFLLVLVLLSLATVVYAEDSATMKIKFEAKRILWETESMQDLLEALEDGAYAVAYVTGDGGDHCIFITKADENYLYAYDPSASKTQRFKLSDAEELGLTFFYVFNDIN
jgi:uncharacterized protein (DUF1786 family)